MDRKGRERISLITGRRESFEARCRERGYTIEEVRACIASEDGDTITVDETHHAYPRARSGLGDYVASALSAVGITKERVEAVVGGPCGCPERQAALNAAGAKWLGLPPGTTAQAEIDPGTP
jgi:hypothetical protein